MVKTYETVVVFDGILTDDLLQKEHQKLEKFLQSNSQFEKSDVWGKMQLAYQINRKRHGFYCLYIYKTEGNAAALVENELKLNASVLRHMTVVQNPKAPTTMIDPSQLERRDAQMEEAGNETA